MENEEKKIPPYIYFPTQCSELIVNLTDEQAGRVIKHIYAYAMQKEELPTLIDPWEKATASAILDSIEKKLNKYRAQCENGKKGGAPKGNRNAAKNGKTKNSKAAPAKQEKSIDNLPIDELGSIVSNSVLNILCDVRSSNEVNGRFKTDQLADISASACFFEFSAPDCSPLYKNVQKYQR